MGEIIKLGWYKKEVIPNCFNCKYKSQSKTLGFFQCQNPSSPLYNELVNEELLCDHHRKGSK